MFRFLVCLNECEKVTKFVKTLVQFDEINFDAVRGRYVLDAKSIMGLFSLDLSKPLEIVAYFDEKNTDLLEKLKAAVANFLVEK